MLKNHPHRAVIWWLLSGCFLVYVMVVVGCLTRLTHSGLSITEWGFMGTMPPLTDADWMIRFAKYQESPEFKLVNSAMQLDEFKSIFWWEWVHRFIGRTIGFVFMVGLGFLIWKKKIQKAMWPKLAVLVLLGALQGLIGWWMVKSGLVKDPAVSHFRLATHLLSAFTVFAFTFWLAMQLWFYQASERNASSSPLFKPMLGLFVLLIIQIMYGAFVAGLKAGWFYPTWPKMGNEWFPGDVIFANDSWIQAFAYNGAGVQFMHRTLAILLCGFVGYIWFKSNTLALSRKMYLGISCLIFGTLLQFALGVFTLLHGVPVWLGALHQSGAFFLFVVCLFILFTIQQEKREVA